MSTDLATSIELWQRACTDGTFEDAMSGLEAVVQLLDSGDLTLDQSLDCFELGARLSLRCQHLLEQAELRVELVQRTLASEAVSEPPF